MSNEDIKVIKRIRHLETLKTVFLTCTILIGVITVIDIFVPDPIFLLDEAALTAITGLLTVLTSSIDSKIKDLRNGNKLKINNEDISKITSALEDTATAVKKSRNK